MHFTCVSVQFRAPPQSQAFKCSNKIIYPYLSNIYPTRLSKIWNEWKKSCEGCFFKRNPWQSERGSSARQTLAKTCKNNRFKWRCRQTPSKDLLLTVRLLEGIRGNTNETIKIINDAIVMTRSNNSSSHYGVMESLCKKQCKIWRRRSWTFGKDV